MNEFINIDVSSGLVALKPVGKTHFAPSHTLPFSCSIVRRIWSMANQRSEFGFGRATRALLQRFIRICRFFVKALVVRRGLVTCRKPRGTTTRSWEGAFFSLFAR